MYIIVFRMYFMKLYMFTKSLERNSSNSVNITLLDRSYETENYCQIHICCENINFALQIYIFAVENTWQSKPCLQN